MAFSSSTGPLGEIQGCAGASEHQKHALFGYRPVSQVRFLASLFRTLFKPFQDVMKQTKIVLMCFAGSCGERAAGAEVPATQTWGELWFSQSFQCHFDPGRTSMTLGVSCKCNRTGDAAQRPKCLRATNTSVRPS